MMSQTMSMNTLEHASTDNKTYSVNFKGLIKHLFDIVVSKKESTSFYNTAELSDYLRRDIGLQ